MTWCEANTRDAVKARDFYCGLFGLTYILMEGAEYYILQRGGTNVFGVQQMDLNWPESIPPHWLAYFAVSDADETVKKATQNGGQGRGEPFDTPYGRMAVLADPFGAAFLVVAMKAA